MSYKYSKGYQIIGDLSGSDDANRNTGIDFEEDYIGFEASGSTVMVVSGSKVGIGTTTPDYTLDVAGNIGVDQYIYHNGDADTWIRFNDNDMTFKAGNLTFLDIEKKGSAPHELTINDGANNVDFVVKGNGSGEGNPGMKFDASTNRLGINGIGTPDEALHVDGNIKIQGDDPRIKINGDTDSHPGLELYENGTRKWIIFNDYTNDNLTFKTNSNVRMSIEQDGNVGIGTASPVATLTVNGSVASKITSINNSHSPYSITATDHIILADSFGGAITINLPACSSNSGRIIIVKDVGAGAGSNNITISRNGSDQIDGSNSIAINTNRGYVQLVSDGSQFWHQIAKEGVS